MSGHMLEGKLVGVGRGRFRVCAFKVEEQAGARAVTQAPVYPVQHVGGTAGAMRERGEAGGSGLVGHGRTWAFT